MRAVDLFAGFGGFSAGAELAGVRVVWAANHWPVAVDVHRANHPHVEHVCQELRQADWTKLPRFDLLLGSPACQGHSTASQPKRRAYHDAMRSSAWAIVECADVTEPRAIIVENTLGLLQWRLYSVWREALVRIGYHVQEHTLMASDFGVPQERKRLFVIATRRPKTLRFLRALRAPSFGPCIDWDHGDWRPVTSASPDAQGRIAHGRRLGQRFLSQHTTGHAGVSIDKPIRTITTKDQWVVVHGDMYRPLLLREYARAQDFAESYTWPAELSRGTVVKGLGNAVPRRMAAAVIEQVAA